MSPTVLAAGDFDGDGYSDMVGLYPPLNSLWIYQYNGNKWKQISKQINLNDCVPGILTVTAKPKSWAAAISAPGHSTRSPMPGSNTIGFNFPVPIHTEEKNKTEYTHRELLLKKQFEGEHNVLTTKIETLEALLEQYQKQVEQLSLQTEKSYKNWKRLR
jgi:hypothetical protein